MERAQKESELAQLVDNFTKAQVAVCADYRGLTVSKITQLRRELRSVGAEAKVVRNTLARLAVKKVVGDSGNTAELERFIKVIEGPTLVVVSFNDPVTPAKVLTKFAKDAKDKFRVKGCWLDGAYVDPAGVDALSMMPGREETFAMLLRLMQEPATRFARLLNEPGSQLVRVIEAQRKKLGGESAAA
jgi:large subunit ribosomal protein L10